MVWRKVMIRRTCVACGDLISDPMPDENPHVVDAMRAYCQACAAELLGFAVPVVGTLQNDTGGGRRVIRDTKTH